MTVFSTSKPRYCSGLQCTSTSQRCQLSCQLGAEPVWMNVSLAGGSPLCGPMPEVIGIPEIWLCHISLLRDPQLDGDCVRIALDPLRDCVNAASDVACKPDPRSITKLTLMTAKWWSIRRLSCHRAPSCQSRFKACKQALQQYSAEPGPWSPWDLPAGKMLQLTYAL